MSDSDPNLTINCWVLEDDYNNLFKVEISRNKDVTDLKECIKAKNDHLLKDIDARTLILYKVSIQHSPQLAEHVSALELADLRLNPCDDLSEVFANGLPRKHVHLVVEVPSGAWLYVVLSSLR